MKFEQLYPFALLIVAVGVLVGVGVLILDTISTSSATWTNDVVENESLTWGGNGTNVSLDHGNLTVFTKLANASGDAFVSGNYTVFTEAGKVKVLSNTTGIGTGDTVFAYYTWSNRNRASTKAFAAARDALAEIATSWMSLIVLIGALAVILTMVIRSFAGGRGPR